MTERPAEIAHGLGSELDEGGEHDGLKGVKAHPLHTMSQPESIGLAMNSFIGKYASCIFI